MNRKIIKSLKNKYIYVDIDGTLGEYRFNNHVSVKDGTTNGQTIKKIENCIFLYSRPLKTVIKTLKIAKKRGIWICGAIISPIELEDKAVWLEENCKGIVMVVFGLYPMNIGTRFLITLTVVRMIMILLLNMVLSLKVPRIACGIGL